VEYFVSTYGRQVPVPAGDHDLLLRKAHLDPQTESDGPAVGGM
jgi:hypothetical protein